MSQIINITSEALQSTIRRLPPSQQGVGEDLQASNVILPVIDVTPTAEGTQLPTDMREAMAFGSQTTFQAANSTVNLASSGGFWRVFGSFAGKQDATVDRGSQFLISDGLAVKSIWGTTIPSGSAGDVSVFFFDFTVFLRPQDTLQAVADTGHFVRGSYRQIGTLTGELVNPSGFSFG